MPLVRKISRIGNSKGLIIPQPVLDQLNWQNDVELELSVDGSTLVVTPHQYASSAAFKVAAKKVFRERRKMMQRLAK